MAKSEFTHDELVENIHYESATGFFYWKKRGPRRRMDRPIGCPQFVSGKHYWVVGFKRGLFQSHRLAWFYVHATWPPSGFFVDHINGDSMDNRIDNLRLATPTQNAVNVWGGKSYPKGVERCGVRYFAKPSVNGNQLRLGPYKTELEATMVFRQYHLLAYREFSAFWSDFYVGLTSFQREYAMRFFPRPDVGDRLPDGY